ncbi:Pex12 amino terminal region-domain-containing protein [Massariosphaeria phaeospora]|uniref:RING-type E3 ubiquitin transferase (cysteine targeting) n=1 Tax=Massariosphaeria phaeospora TaxID=100035 RepID=A0A7C8IFH6_9PLEO|nr:Pex12 amino terminal region-domain-containing protein [Massariosphaeria phaeospora]
MPSADFAAAQERIAARRAQRAAHARAQHESSSASARTLSRLPYPFNRFSSAGVSAWDAIKGREGTRPEFRVGQVDAELLDEELLNLLKGQVGEGLKYFGSHITDSYTPEILLGLRLILFKLSIWNNDASYGAHLQGLRYADARSNSPARPPPKPWQKAAYGIITIGGRYAWTKWEEYLLSTSEDYTTPQSPTLALFSRLTENLNSVHDMASLASFLTFLYNGRYRTLTDRFLRLRLTPTSHSTSREVSFEYLNRQLVWHAFTEFLLFLLPLVGISRWRRILGRTWRKLRSSFLALLGRAPANTSDADDENKAAATDITNPYETVPCGCIYCFACLAQRIANEEGEGWTCLRCGDVVKECRPWSGDILEETPRPSQSQSQSQTQSTHHAHGPGKTVGFASYGDAHDGDEEAEKQLRVVDPIPEQEDGSGSVLGGEDGALGGVDQTRGLGLGESLALAESREWGRASSSSSSSSEEDNQSEEYDEDEDEEGQELG